MPGNAGLSWIKQITGHSLWRVLVRKGINCAKKMSEKVLRGRRDSCFTVQHSIPKYAARPIPMLIFASHPTRSWAVEEWLCVSHQGSKQHLVRPSVSSFPIIFFPLPPPSQGSPLPGLHPRDGHVPLRAPRERSGAAPTPTINPARNGGTLVLSLALPWF